MNQPLLTVALMLFNEIEGLQTTVEELLSTLRASQITFELLIIDDGSQDGSEQVASRLAESYAEVSLHRHPHNQGLGEVYRSGFRLANGEWLTFFPADGEVPADCIPAFLEAMPENDLLLGWIPQSKRSLPQVFLSFCERTLYRLLFGPFPMLQGIFMIRCQELRRHKLRSKGRSWVNLKELILRATRGGCRYKTIRTSLRPRYGGISKARTLKLIVLNLLEAVRLRLEMLAE
ncbi:MAG: glycosyltransferase family 2 protein [Vulcanimicrobiota bacterium]